MQQVRITTWQVIFLIISIMLPTAILTLPSTLVNHARSDAWISLLLATMAGIFCAYVSGTISIKYPGLTIFQIMEKTLGRLSSKVIGFILTYYYFSSCLGILRQFMDFMIDSVMKHMPPLVFAIVPVLLAIYALYYGIEVIARVNQIILMTSFFVFAVSTLFYFKEMQFDRLLPIMESPLNKILIGAVSPLGWLSEVSVILLLAPYLAHPGQARKAAVLGVTLTGLSMLWTLIGSIIIFGVNTLSLFAYPTFNVFRIIEVAGFLERIDALFISVWVGTMIMKLTVYMFGGFYCLTQTFAIQDQIPFLFPYGMLTISLSICSWRNIADFTSYQTYTAPSRLLFTNMVIPIFLLLVVLWKNRKKWMDT
ncbi:endospore germination permease [Ectobacillus funiculus]|uniref:GerAB/ArcD/ProY family transporter n=1 Tax=Ectobacillus funiculus TaxID=137993 RepID=UPI003979408C